MVQKSEELKKEIKKELKKGKHKWQDVMDRITPKSCNNHDFRYQGFGNHVQCRMCGVGYKLPAEGELREGHIYLAGQLVI